jgi:tripartite-type tricarboxylate transporter receptor subunit TctC
LGGRVHVVIENPSSFASSIAAGKLKTLAVATAQRVADQPDVATVAETFPGFVAMGWVVMMGPPGTPESIASKASVDLRTVLAMQEVQRRIADVGSHVQLMSGEELLTFIRSEREAWRPTLAALARETPK